MTAELLNPAHYGTGLFALSTLLTASTLLALGLMVLIRERHSRVSISFFVMTATAAIWLFGYSIMYCAATTPVAAAWSIIGQVGIVFIPASVYHFTVASLQIYNPHKHRVVGMGNFRYAFSRGFLRRHVCFWPTSLGMGLLS